LDFKSLQTTVATTAHKSDLLETENSEYKQRIASAEHQIENFLIEAQN